MSTNTHMSFSRMQLQRAFGFRDVSNLLPHFTTVYQPTFSISNTDKEPIISVGESTIVPRTRTNSNPIPLPDQFGDTVHVDTVFGSWVAIAGVKYALFFVDRATRCKYIYPLHNLKDDIIQGFKDFIAELGFTPARFICDCDRKLFGKKIRNFLINKGSIITATPGGRQSQNGLCESNWKTIVKMTRSWIASALLPPQFWWYAIKRACEVTNYVPIKVNGEITTPFKLTYNTKPDLRNLVPFFSVVYLRSYREGKSNFVQTSPHSIRTICVGRAPDAKSLLFYHPSTYKLLLSDDYTLDEIIAAGPAFGLQYQGSLYFNKYKTGNDLLRPSTYAPDQIIFVKLKYNTVQGKIITILA